MGQEITKKTRRKFHACVDIAGALKRSDQWLDGILSEDGKDLTGPEVRAFLHNVRDEHGYTYYSGCNNMNSDGRCAGHDAA